MSVQRLLLSASLLLALVVANAQKFWLTTYEFPGGPKTGIAASGDTCLFAGLTRGVLRSWNEGDRWDTVLAADNVYTVFATENGTVMAGGRGKVYYSSDYGSHWDSVSLGNYFPVRKFVRHPSGSFFAITGELDFNLGYVGAGVFYSPNGGATWTARNNGLGAYLSCDQLAVDKNGRLYVTASDEYVTGNGGLFISDNEGQIWEHVSIRIDGRGVIDDGVKIEISSGMDVSRDDTLYLSISGVNGNVGVRLNLSKHISAVQSNDFWRCMKVGNSISWWLDRLLNGIHFSLNGDYYSSVTGTANFGGTFFSKNQGQVWTQQLQGLGYDISGLYGRQTFAEKSSGKVFMVQYLDERIYWADTSRTITGADDLFQEPIIQLYPNPVSDKLWIETSGYEPVSAAIYSSQGQKLSEQPFKNPIAVEPLPAGVYVIEILDRKLHSIRKLFVKY